MFTPPESAYDRVKVKTKVPTYEWAMRIQPSLPVAIGFVAIAVFAVLEVGQGAPVSFIYFQF